DDELHRGQLDRLSEHRQARLRWRGRWRRRVGWQLDQAQAQQVLEILRRRAGLLRQAQHLGERAPPVDQEQDRAVALAELVRAKAKLVVAELGLEGNRGDRHVRCASSQAYAAGALPSVKTRYMGFRSAPQRAASGSSIFTSSTSRLSWRSRCT